MNRENIISYPFEEFISHQKTNCILPQHLERLCGEAFAKPTISIYSEPLYEIISTILQGQDPNDINIKNQIKYCIIALDSSRYDAQLEKIKQLSIKNKSNCIFLATELINCITTCPLSVKGFIFKSDTTDNKSIPEVCADLIRDYGTYDKNINDSLNFTIELLKIANEKFKLYMSDDISMDENNVYTSESYKGFMTFIGLMYSHNIIGSEIVTQCLTKIKNVLFFTENQKYKRSQCECANYYKGYEFLLSHINNHISSIINKIPIAESNEISEDDVIHIKKLCTHINNILIVHNELISLNLKTENGQSQLKPYNIAYHNKSGEMLNSFLVKLDKYHNYDTKYIKHK
jgi:hypothetical protein